MLIDTVTQAHAAAPGARLQALQARTLEFLADLQGALFGVKDMASGTYLHVNEAMAAWLGRPVTDVVGRTDAELLDPILVSALRAAEHTALAQGGPLVSEHRFDWRGARHDYRVLRFADAPDHEGRRLLATVWTDLAAPKAKDGQLRVALEQLEQQQRANEHLRRELEDQTLRDPATGLYTRSHFDDQLKREVDLSTREHREFAMVFIALDAGSATTGEAASEPGSSARTRVLEALGRLLRSNTRAMDASCRLDDARFAVLLSGVGLATAHARMDSLRRSCAAHLVVLDGNQYGFTISMGIASFPHTASDEAELVFAAHKALAQARMRGNHVSLASISLGG